MKQIKANTPGQAWKKLLKEVLKYGEQVMDGDTKLLESLNVIITVKNPTKTDSTIEKYADKKMLEWMKNNFLSQNPVDGWGYSYGQRIFNYNGDNQLEQAIKKFKKNIQTKSATLTLSCPPEDKKHSPCVNVIDFKFRNNQLNATVFIRSQDAGKKAYADIISLGTILNGLANEINVNPGDLIIHVSSLHIYEPDLNDLKNKFPDLF